jgi:hypothetical protein
VLVAVDGVSSRSLVVQVTVVVPIGNKELEAGKQAAFGWLESSSLTAGRG